MSKIVLEDFNEGDGYYKVNLAYLNKEQVEEIEALVSRWKPTDEDIINCIGMCLTDANEQRFKDYGTNLKECLAWLEKQGEQKDINPTLLEKEKMDNAFTKMMFKGKTALEAIHEEKIDNANKVEQKFNEGDWIIFNGWILHIDEVVNGYYRTTSIGGIPNSYDWNIDNAARLWTIQDAKDGDVLISHNNQPFIYNGNFDSFHIGAHCGITISGAFVILSTPCDWTGHKNLHPATKEQRELLFSEIKEAGYEWDGDKKELRKIEQKPADKVEPHFHEGDWITDGQLTCKVLGITDKSYELHLYNDDNCHFETDVQSIDKHYYLWGIKDAKDGDILTSINFHSSCTFIFKGLDNWKFDEPNGDRVVATGYCCLSASADKMEFGIQGPDCVEVNTIKPATKIQRDLLFVKMKEAGYEWDEEKKELKKIEKWSEEDERERKRVVGLLEGWLSTFKETYYAEECKFGIEWLKSLKKRMEE